jgi:hypothetical protein
LAKKLEDNATALKEIKELLKKNERNVPSRNFTPSSDSYCWYHGYKLSRTHTSQTCMYPKYGHQREASKKNNMGESQVNGN